MRDGLRAWHKRASNIIERSDFAMVVRAEDRRPRVRARVRRRAAAHGRHARRRHARREHHAERAHDPLDPAAACRRTVRRALRGARRDLHDEERLRAAERGARRGRPAALRQPAQLRRRLRAPARPEGHGSRGRSMRSGTSSAGRTAGATPTTHWDVLQWLKTLGLPGQPEHPALQDARRGRRVLRELGREARLARLRDRRHRDQGRRPGAAAAAGRRRPRAALGDRLQVPADAGDDEAAADRRERRPHRHAQPVRRARARRRSAARRSSWRRCTTRRTSAARTSASATPSSSSAPATSSRRSSGRC